MKMLEKKLGVMIFVLLNVILIVTIFYDHFFLIPVSFTSIVDPLVILSSSLMKLASKSEKNPMIL